MRREEVQELLRRVPEADHCKTVIVLAGGQGVNIETVFRMEPEYLIVRGREVGSNDEGRAFFLPYAEVSFIKLERLVALEELANMFTGGKLPAGVSDKPIGAATTPAPTASAPTPPPAGPVLDPTAIAKQNLLERLRAARTSGGSPVFTNKVKK